MCPGRRIQVSLTEEQYERLRSLAQKRDACVSELVRQAIEQVYMSDLEQDLTAIHIQRLGKTSLLLGDEEEAIGIRGGGPGPEDIGRAAG